MRIRQGHVVEEYGSRQRFDSGRRRYFVFKDKVGGHKRVEFPALVARPSPREWGLEASQELMARLIEARCQIQAPCTYIAEQMEVAPEIIYRIEGGGRDVALSTAMRYAHSLGLEFEVVEPE